MKLLPLKLADLVAVRIFYLGAPENEYKQEKSKNTPNTALYAFESFCQLFQRDLSPHNILLQYENRTIPEIGIFDNLRWRFLQRIFPQYIGRSGAFSISKSLLLHITEAFPTATVLRVLNSPHSDPSSAPREMALAYATSKGMQYLEGWYEDPSSPDLTQLCYTVGNRGDVFFSHRLTRVLGLERRLQKCSRC